MYTRLSLRPAVIAAAFVTAALAVTGCSSTKPAADANGSEVRLVKSGQLTTCTHLPYEPFQFKKGQEIVGFDVDIVDLVAKELKVGQEIIDTPFEGIQSGEDLNAGKCDLAAAGMTITDVRKQNLDFASPYFDATQALITKKGAGHASLADLDGKKLGVQASTTGEEYAKKEAKGAELIQFEDLALLLTAVQTGQVAAGIGDNGVLYDFAKQNADLEVVTEFDTGEQYGIGVRKGNTALREKIDAVVKEARGDGRYDAIYAKWFGTAPQS